MLLDWLAVAFLFSVLLHVLHLVSFVVLWFALSAVGSALLLPDVGFALLPAVGFALLGSFHHRSRSLCSSRCPRTFVALLRSSYHWLVGCGSVSESHRLLLDCGFFCVSLSPLALCLWFRQCFFFRVTLWKVTTPWFVSNHGKLVYNNVFCFCGVWSERFVASAARWCSPMPLRPPSQ